MPTSTYIPLANVTLASNAVSVTFSSINQSYKDLILVYNGSASGYYGSSPGIRFNNQSVDNYAWNYLEANGSGVEASTGTGTWGAIQPASGINPTQRILTTVNLMDYSATDKYKTWISSYGSGSLGNGVLVGRWPDTGAITSVSFGVGFTSTVFYAGSTFALYGIAA